MRSSTIRDARRSQRPSMSFALARLTSDWTMLLSSAFCSRSLAIWPSVRSSDQAGREIAARRLDPLHRAVLVERDRERLEPRQIGLGVVLGVDRVGGVEEIGHREIGAALLEDPVGPDRAVEAEALRRDHLVGQRIGDDLEVELRRRRQRRAVDRRELGQRLP